MSRISLSRGRLIALLSGLAVAGAAAALFAGSASAHGRLLQGTFCTETHTCMALALPDGTTFNSSTRAVGATGPDVTLRPGIYWLAVTDNSDVHNFALRSCRHSTAACTADNPAAGAVRQLTPLCNETLNADGTCPRTGQEIDRTIPVLLRPGHTYRLLCQATGHEAAGMYVDIAVARGDEGNGGGDEDD